jgi:SPP1 gp7 family putative phage head morphogenesis protein
VPHFPSLEGSGVGDDWDKLLDHLINLIWKTQGLPDKLDKKLLQAFAQVFTNAVLEGLGDFIETTDDSEQEFIDKLKDNVWQFSAAKTWSQMKALSEQLVDVNGKRRSFKDFKIEAAKINDEFVGAWLKTEYDLAVASSQMGAKWLRIQQDKETLPFLKYVTVGDDRVREEHQQLEGIILRVDDDFWLIYFPPNGYKCRCDVEQLSYVKKVTDLSKMTLPEIPALFRFNPGIEGLAFPPGHPYYDGMPDDINDQLKKIQS